MPRLNVPFGLVALSAAAVAQQTTVVDIFLPAYDPQGLVASVQAVEKSVTTFVLECEPGTESLECGLPMGATIVQGESTLSQSTSYSDESGEFGEMWMTYACDVDRPNDSVVCEMSQVETYDGTTDSHSTVETLTGISTFYQPITVTAGVDKLEPSPGASTTAADTTATTATSNTESESTGASESTSATESESTGTAEPTNDDAEETESNSDNAGPRATQNAVVAGMVGIIGAAAVVM